MGHAPRQRQVMDERSSWRRILRVHCRSTTPCCVAHLSLLRTVGMETRRRRKIGLSAPFPLGDSSTDATCSLGKPRARAAVRPSPGERLVLYKDAALREEKTSALLSLRPGRAPGAALAGVWSKGEAMRAQRFSETKPAPEMEQQRFRPSRIASMSMADIARRRRLHLPLRGG